MYRCAFETAEVYLCHIFHFGKSFFITLKMPTSRVGISPKKDRPPLIRELKQPQPDGLIIIKSERHYSNALAFTSLRKQCFFGKECNKNSLKNIRPTILFPAKTNPGRNTRTDPQSRGERNTVFHLLLLFFDKKKNYCHDKKRKN
jgi:hypothetical protein